MSFGLSAAFWPIILPLFQGTRTGLLLVLASIEALLERGAASPPFRRRQGRPWRIVGTIDGALSLGQVKTIRSGLAQRPIIIASLQQ